MTKTFTYTIQDPSADSVLGFTVSKDDGGVLGTYSYILRDERGNRVKEGNVGLYFTAQELLAIRNILTNKVVPAIMAQEGL